MCRYFLIGTYVFIEQHYKKQEIYKILFDFKFINIIFNFIMSRSEL